MAQIHIRSLDDNEIVHSIEVKNPRSIDRVMGGLLQQMDLAKYFIDDTEFDEWYNSQSDG